MPTQVRAYAAQSDKSSIAPFTIERRDLNPTDIEIDILYCGICHSDLHQARGDWGNSLYPMVPGHEILGRVTAVGSDVDKFKVGDIAGVGCLVDSCRHCDACDKGLEQYCENGATVTYNGRERINPDQLTFGGYSEKIVVEERFVVKVPETMDLQAVAPPVLRWNHHLLAAAPLENRSRHESRRDRPRAGSAIWASSSPTPSARKP